MKHRRDRGPRRRLRRAALALLVASLLGLAGWSLRPATAPADAARSDAGGAAAEARSVLRRWDVDRSACWEAGDPACLAGLYVAGSAAGAADGAALRAWTSRGLRVVGLRTQVFAIDVHSRADGRWVLDVTDRAVGGRAVDATGAERVLPVAQPTRRRIDLRRVDGVWLVAGARRHPVTEGRSPR